MFTHDSIGVGEDGPTHQPIEQLARLRAIPGLIVHPPGDANEVVEAWKVIMQLQHEPAALVLTRQNAADARPHEVCAGRRRGQGRLHPGRRRGRQAGSDPDRQPAAKSQLCVDAYEQLKAEGIKARVVSMPSWDLFEHAGRGYREDVLPPDSHGPRLRRAGIHLRLGRDTSARQGTIIGMHTFGASAPLKELPEEVWLHVPTKSLRRAREAIIPRAKVDPCKFGCTSRRDYHQEY